MYLLFILAGRTTSIIANIRQTDSTDDPPSSAWLHDFSIQGGFNLEFTNSM